MIYLSSLPFPKTFSDSLNKIIGCTIEGRQICKGLCCRKTVGYGRFYPEEVNKLPKDMKRVLVQQGNEYVAPSVNGHCFFQNDCLKNPELKPIQCWLFPLRVMESGLLTVHRYAWFHCPCYKLGELPIWRNLRRDIIHVFGKRFYIKLAKEMMNRFGDT